MPAPITLHWLHDVRAGDWTAAWRPTPVVAVSAVTGGRQVTITLKLESANKWGSIKDRTALGLVASVAPLLEDPRATLIESTSGNLCIALAEIAKALDRRFIAVVDPNLPPTSAVRITRTGAQLDFVSQADKHGGYLDARLARVAHLLETMPGVVWTDQYHNPANPFAHFRSIAPEILHQVRDPDAIFIAVSTGGTLAGISRYMRLHAPQARIIAVDVPGSRIFGEPSCPRVLTGIGASRESSFLAPGDWDDVALVDDAAAIAVCHQLRATTGISLGGSGGAVVAACLRYSLQHPDTVAPVCVCPDGGAAYESTIYASSWLESRSIQPNQCAPAAIFRRIKEWTSND
jgi:2,3-diaminopropionate biosynthesis protein SbnA